MSRMRMGRMRMGTGAAVMVVAIVETGCAERNASTKANAPTAIAAWVVDDAPTSNDYRTPAFRIDPNIATGNLATLHHVAVSQFVVSEGFGPIRVPRMQIRHESIPKPSLWANPHGYHFSDFDGWAGAEAGWTMNQLQLAGFLKDPAGVVYQIPMAAPAGMADLPKFPTRPLNGFEKEAVARLKDGRMYAAFVDPDQFQMVGAIRLTAECSRCHKEPVGTMAGAFTYAFSRRPEPYRAPEADTAASDVAKP